MGLTQEILSANRAYAESSGARRQLPAAPVRRLAILTCMDARIDPAKVAGLSEGDAHVVRNAGGRASDDAIRSLVISHMFLGTTDWFIVHHTDCGMQRVSDESMVEVLAARLGPAAGQQARRIDWLGITDPHDSVRHDLERLRTHPLVPEEVTLHGFIYDVMTGLLEDVVEATRAAGPP